MTRPTRMYPSPADPEARYDAVVRRGAELRRRRHLTVGAGAGGALAAVIMAVALITIPGGSSQDQLLADGGTPETSPTTAAVPPPEVMTVKVSPTENAITVLVRDPEQLDDPRSTVCALVRVAHSGEPGPAVAEGFACSVPGSTAPSEAPLRLTNGAEVGCAAISTPDPDPPSGTRHATSQQLDFTVAQGSLPAGEYTVEVTAVSGIGDGCSPQDDVLANSATAAVTLDIP